MEKAIGRSNLMLVELDKGVLARTSIPGENHSALRAGFAGYTSNPRWCASKFVAWRTGRSWRDALQNGTLAIRQSDSMLVPAEEAQPCTKSQPQKNRKLFGGFNHRHQAHSINDTPHMQQA